MAKKDSNSIESAAWQGGSVFLIHRGLHNFVVPAVTKEVYITNPNAKNFGSGVVEVVEPEYSFVAELPKGTKFGNYKIGEAYAIYESAVADQLRKRGFEDATDAEISVSTRRV